jgi:hypothetical protein
MIQVRLYYKSSRGFPFIWSVDFGNITSQVVVTDFHIGKGCEVSGGHDYVSNIENSPKAFIAVQCNKVVFENDEVFFS